MSDTCSIIFGRSYSIAPILRTPMMCADMGSRVKALLATAVFTLTGVLSLVFVAPKNAVVLPHVLFYAILTLNSYFSIKVFASIQPRHMTQLLFDALLAIIYVALALSIGQAVFFALAGLFVFVVATPKY